MPKHTIGIDFGTESARAVLVDVASGRVAATASVPFPHGVIDRSLPGQSDHLPPDWALQHPGDWVAAAEQLLRTMAQHANPDDIVGLGVDCTSCTVLPVTTEGTPLCLQADFARDPHAWPKLWKHHAAQPYADRINAARARAGGAFLEFYGGKTSSEWLWAKGWQVLAEAPAVARATARWIEGGDWIVWQLTGTEMRSACQAGYKAHWQKDSGYPDGAFLRGLDPALPQWLERLAPPHPVARKAGGLLSAWAARTGLHPGTPVAVAVIDAHAGMPAVGAAEAGQMVAIMGTSTCHLLVDPRRFAIPGISGVVEDGIVPGLFGYEAGQASVGDIFQWFVRSAVPARVGTGDAAYETLAAQAGRLRPGEAGVMALDWWNGCRTPLVDADLSGLLVPSKPVGWPSMRCWPAEGSLSGTLCCYSSPRISSAGRSWQRRCRMPPPSEPPSTPPRPRACRWVAMRISAMRSGGWGAGSGPRTVRGQASGVSTSLCIATISTWRATLARAARR